MPSSRPNRTSRTDTRTQAPDHTRWMALLCEIAAVASALGLAYLHAAP